MDWSAAVWGQQCVTLDQLHRWSSTDTDMDAIEFVDNGYHHKKKITKSKSGQRRPAYQRYPKPPYSYVGIIATAILNSPDKMLTLSEILEYLKMMFKFFSDDYHGWKDSIRHNLSHCKCFIKTNRVSAENSKASYWTVDTSLLPPNCFKRQETTVARLGHFASHLHDELHISRIEIPHHEPSTKSKSSSGSTNSSSSTSECCSPSSECSSQYSDISEPRTPDTFSANENVNNSLHLLKSPVPGRYTPFRALREGTEEMARDAQCLSDASPSTESHFKKRMTPTRKRKRSRASRSTKVPKTETIKVDSITLSKYEQLKALVTTSATNWGVSTSTAIDNLRLLCIGMDNAILEASSDNPEIMPVDHISKINVGIQSSELQQSETLSATPHPTLEPELTPHQGDEEVSSVDATYFCNTKEGSSNVYQNIQNQQSVPNTATDKQPTFAFDFVTDVNYDRTFSVQHQSPWNDSHLNQPLPETVSQVCGRDSPDSFDPENRLEFLASYALAYGFEEYPPDFDSVSWS